VSKNVYETGSIISSYITQFIILSVIRIEDMGSYATPTNERMLDTLKMMETPVQWSNLFDSRSPFRMLYVDWLLRGGDEAVDADEWCARFLDNSGLDYSLSDGHEGSMSVKKRACLGLLLKVIDFFASSK